MVVFLFFLEWRRCVYLGGAAQVIVINFFYRLEVDHTLQLGLMFICGGEKEREKKKNVEGFGLQYIDNDRVYLGVNREAWSPALSPRITTRRTHDTVRPLKRKKKEKKKEKKSNFDHHDQFMVCDDGWKKTSTALFSVFFKTLVLSLHFSDLTAFLRYSGTSLQFVSSATAELQ